MGAREKNFIIRGSPDAVERAKAMIMEKIGMPVTASTYGNYGDSPGGGSSWGGGGGPYGQPGGAGVPGGMPGPGGVNPSTGQPDYSAQWADYYKSVGMLREAEAIEQQMRGRPGQAQLQHLPCNPMWFLKQPQLPTEQLRMEEQTILLNGLNITDPLAK